MKIIFNGLIGQLDTDKERIDEFEDIKRNFQNWNAKRKKQTNKQKIQEMGNNCKRCRIHKMELPEGGEKG